MAAADEGLRALLLESTDKWGGNTAMSGGGMWLPSNPLMRREGAGDSREEALAYMEATIGDEGRATSRERKEAFVDGIADFVSTAEKYGVELVRAPDYADYYPGLPGGKVGRAVEGLYSAGNNSASVMGRTYPGPGSTIGPAVVFGVRAARHMASAG